MDNETMDDRNKARGHLKSLAKPASETGGLSKRNYPRNCGIFFSPLSWGGQKDGSFSHALKATNLAFHRDHARPA